MSQVLIAIHLMVVLAMIGLVLLQRSEGGALGIGGGGGGGGGGGFMSARGAGNVLTRATAILAAIFFATSIALTLVARYEAGPSDILDRIPAQTGPAVPVGGAEETDGTTPSGGGVLDAFRPSTGAPADNAGPQVPTEQSEPADTAPAAPAQAPAPASETPAPVETPALPAPEASSGAASSGAVGPQAPAPASGAQ